MLRRPPTRLELKPEDAQELDGELLVGMLAAAARCCCVSALSDPHHLSFHTCAEIRERQRLMQQLEAGQQQHGEGGEQQQAEAGDATPPPTISGRRQPPPAPLQTPVAERIGLRR